MQWPVVEVETLRRKRAVLLCAEAEAKAGGLREIGGIVSSQADDEAVFQIPSIEDTESFDPNWLLYPDSLCGEKGASVQGGIGPIGLLVCDGIRRSAGAHRRCLQGVQR